jgi:hypothetical protein
MAGLDPVALAKAYTLIQIDAKIAALDVILTDTATSKEYALDTTQGNQRVQAQELKSVTDLMNSWLQARALKVGEADGTNGAKFYSCSYQTGYRND